MKLIYRIAAAGLFGLMSACTTQAPPLQSVAPATASPVETKAPVTILVSIDGFRSDYLDRGVTPNLSALAANGVRASMIPSFPSKTFPNHWALVTGEYPDHNGITANKMEDPRRPGEVFTMATDDPFWWDEAEPVWVAAEKAGIRTATMFWPGANVAWGGKKADAWPYDIDGGTRPEDWQQFNEAVTGTQRVNAVLDWMRRPADIRPRFVTLYFDTVDTSGHRFGPDSAETTQAVADVDSMIGKLEAGLKQLDQPANLIIVADHGMAANSTDRVVALDKVADPSLYQIVEAGPYATLIPAPGKNQTLAAKLLAPHDHMTCWRKGNIPARFHYGTNPRIPPYLCLAETGWQIVPSAKDARDGGNHGYDNRSPEMAALFIAIGPAFAKGATIDRFENVDVEPLIRELLHLPANPKDDGSAAPFAGVLRLHD